MKDIKKIIIREGFIFLGFMIIAAIFFTIAFCIPENSSFSGKYCKYDNDVMIAGGIIILLVYPFYFMIKLIINGPSELPLSIVSD